MTRGAPSFPALAELFHHGHTRVPDAWRITGPAMAGLWWCATDQEVVGTPLLLRRADEVESDGERVGLLLATEPRFRDRWLTVMALRLAEIGRRNDVADLCRQIDALGAAAAAVHDRVACDRIAPTPDAALELSLFGTPADQPAAAPCLLRVLGTTAALMEGGQGQETEALSPVDSSDPGVNWVAGRLLQMPGNQASGGSAVLPGAVRQCPDPADSAARMTWVLETPWVTLLAVLAFTVEAWAAERQGGLQLELPARLVQHFARPPEVDVVVTLADGQEILCGTLGELCLRALDALGMAVVPVIDTLALDRVLGTVVAELLRAGIWRFKPEGRTRYVIADGFGFDCYRGEGHRHIFLGAETLSQALRSVAVTWAKARAEQASREGRA